MCNEHKYVLLYCIFLYNKRNIKRNRNQKRREVVTLQKFSKADSDFIIKQIKRLTLAEKEGLKLVYSNCYHLSNIKNKNEVLDESLTKEVIAYIESFKESKTLTSQGKNIFNFINELITTNDKTETILEYYRQLRGYYILLLTYKIESLGPTSEKREAKLNKKLVNYPKYKLLTINDNLYISSKNSEEFMCEYYIKGSNYSYRDYLKGCKLEDSLVSLLLLPEELVRTELNKLTNKEKEGILSKLTLGIMEGSVKIKELDRLNNVLL